MCGILLRHADNSIDKTPSVYVVGNCAVIGGPLTLAVSDPPNQPVAPVHDGDDPSKPIHLQYFGFDPTSTATPTGTQIPRFVGSASTQNQPDDTFFLWSYGALTDLYEDGDGFIILGASAAGGPIAVSCTMSLTFTDMYGVTASLSVADDTAQTPLQPVGQTPQYTPNTFNVHEPGSLTLLSKASAVPSPPSGGTSCGDNYYFQLLDTTGVPQTAVWVQEAFDAAAGNTFPPNLQTNMNNPVNPGFKWTSDLQGNLTNDKISALWNPPAPWSNYGASHRFRAATKTFVGGLPVATRSAQWNYGDINNSPSHGTTQN